MLRWRYAWAAVWLACLGGFVALGAWAAQGEVWSVNVDVVRWVQGGPRLVGWLSDAANATNASWSVALIIAAAAVILMLRRSPVEALLVLGTLAPRALQHELKYVFDEPRPAAMLVRVTEIQNNPGYPSGHVVGSVALFGLLFAFAPLMFGRRRPATLAVRAYAAYMVVWMPIARMWVGAHWPTDCLGAYLFAALYLGPAIAVCRARRR